jgi:hypothetical protein
MVADGGELADRTPDIKRDAPRLWKRLGHTLRCSGTRQSSGERLNFGSLATSATSFQTHTGG